MNSTEKATAPALSEPQVQAMMQHIKKHENPQNIKHPYFDSKGNLTAAGRKLREEITQRAAKARIALGAENWKKLPPGVQETIVDIAYTNGGIEKWEGLKKAVKDYEPGSAESLEAVAKETFWRTGEGPDGEKRRPEGRFHDNLKKIFGGDENRAKKFHQENHPDKAAPVSELKPPETAAQPQPQTQPQTEAGAEDKSPDAARIRALVRRVHDDPFDSAADLLLLRPDQITPEQARALGMAYAELPPGDPRREEFARQKTAYFEHVYGDAPQRKDYTGRPMDDGPKNPPPETPSRPRDASGADIAAALQKTAGVMAHYAEGTGLSPAVAALQSGLNLMERAHLARDKTEAEKQRKSGVSAKPETPFTFHGLLKEDGDFGPKTHAQLKRAAARAGAGAAKNALALGGFRALARSAKGSGASASAGTGTAAAAKNLVESHMGALFPAHSQAPKRKPQVMALQSALNAMRPAGTGALKEDGDFGPKTSQVFSAAAAKHSPDGLTERFARELGFIN